MHIIDMDITWDPAKAASNSRKHGVSFADAEAVLSDPMALTPEDTDAIDELRFVSLGLSARGELLVVVYTCRAEHIRLLSARRATHRETTAYEKGI